MPTINSRHNRYWIILEAALEYFITILTSGAFLARVTGALGFSDSLTGILSSFVSLGCLFQLGALVLCRRMVSAKRPVILCHLLNELLFALVYVAPASLMSPQVKTAIFLISFCLAYVLFNIIRARKVSWLMSLIDDRSRGIFTAKKEMFSLLSGMIYTYLMGALIDHLEAANHSRLAFGVGAGVILTLTALHLFSITRIEDNPQPAKNTLGIGSTLKTLWQDREIRRVVLVNIIWHIALYSAYPFYGAYQINELGFSMTFVSILSILYSVVRMLFSPLMGKYADRRSFSHMSFVCFAIMGVGFAVNCFTVPENGAVFYTTFYCLYGVSMAGANSAVTNLLFDKVQGEMRTPALAINMALSGVAGFLSTCVMSVAVAAIQQNGNQLFGMPMYAAQFVSFVALVLVALLLVYMRLTLLKRSSTPS